ncbi:hypothetical protein, partial [Candidatus Methylacidiphilum fumarolicum]
PHSDTLKKGPLIINNLRKFHQTWVSRLGDIDFQETVAFVKYMGKDEEEFKEYLLRSELRVATFPIALKKRKIDIIFS